jgi:mannitol/fructose-specific phosphotransferase system IIA component (Ntr-type)
MQRGDVAGYLTWLTLVGSYVAVVLPLGRIRNPPASAERRPLLRPIRSARRSAPPPTVQRRTMPISSLLSTDLVLPSLSAQTKADVLNALAAHVGRAHPNVDARRLSRALYEREQQSTTALENGVAIPHVRLAGLAGAIAALARTTSGIPCGAADGRPTRLFLLLVAPAEEPHGLLKLLAEAARLLSDAHCRDRLLEAGSADELLTVLREDEERIHRALRAA